MGHHQYITVTGVLLPLDKTGDSLKRIKKKLTFDKACKLTTIPDDFLILMGKCGERFCYQM